MPKITQLTDSFNFIYSEKFSSVLEEIKAEFDLVIIDTAPILSVADTQVLMGFSDVNFVVCRHGLSKINEIKQTLSIAQQVGMTLME